MIKGVARNANAHASCSKRAIDLSLIMRRLVQAFVHNSCLSFRCNSFYHFSVIQNKYVTYIHLQLASQRRLI